MDARAEQRSLNDCPHDTRSRPATPRPPCEECIYQVQAAQAREEGRRKVLVALQGWRYKAMNGTLKKDVWKKWNEETELIESLRNQEPQRNRDHRENDMDRWV